MNIVAVDPGVLRGLAQGVSRDSIENFRFLGYSNQKNTLSEIFGQKSRNEN